MELNFGILNTNSEQIIAMLINIHSHRAGGQDEITIRNIHQQFTEPLPLGYFSAGIHPLFINPTQIDQQLEELSTLLQHPSVVAVGECGLDKRTDFDMKLQMKVFTEQIKLANQVDKPLVIHCVKAFDELRSLLKKNDVQVPVIYHGFAKIDQSLVESLLQDGAYLSFGKSLFNHHMFDLFKQVPDDRFFLETDDSEISIESVYIQAAKLKKYNYNNLSNILIYNLKQAFNTIII